MQHYLEEKSKISNTIHWILNNPWKMLLANILLLAALFPAFKYIEADFSYRTWFREGDPLLHEFDQFERKFGNDDSIVIAVESKSGIFDKETVTLLQNLTQDMWKVQEIIRVDSLTNYNWVHGNKNAILVEPLLLPESGELAEEFLKKRKAVALKDETIPNYLLSSDATTAVLFARIKPAIVNYKKAIENFIESGKIEEQEGSYIRFMQKYASNSDLDNDSLGGDDSLEDDDNKNSEKSQSVFSQISTARNLYLNNIVSQIADKEKAEKQLLNYFSVKKTIKRNKYPDFSMLKNKLPEEAQAEFEEMQSQDKEDLLQLIKLHEKNKSPYYEGIVKDTKKVLDKYKGRGDHKFYINGGAYLSDTFRESTMKDMATMVPLALSMIILFLALTFRKIGGIIIALTVVFATDLAIMAFMGIFSFRFNNITSIVPQVLIAIGIADSVHILVGFYLFLKRGLDKHSAAFLSLRKNLTPTILTSLSTAMGFFSFTTSKVDPIASLGILAGVGTLLAWVFCYTLLAPLMKLLPVKIKVREKEEDESDLTSLSPRSIKITELLYKYRIIIFTVFGVATIFFFVVSLHHKVNSDPFKYFVEGSEIRTSLDFMENKTGAAMGVEISINSGKNEGIKEPAFLAKVEKLQKWLEQRKVNGKHYITKTVSILEILKSMNRTLNGGEQNQYVIPKQKEIVAEELFLYTMNLPVGMDINDRMTIRNDGMRMTILWTLHDTMSILGEISHIKKAAEGFGLKIHVTGKQVLFQSLNPYVVSSFIVSIIAAVLLVSALLIFAFKSFKLGLFAMIPNLIPLIFGSGLIWLYGKDLDMGIIIVFAICLGIAVDDTIHFMENYRKNIAEGKTPQEAVAHVFTFTVKALVTTTLVLIASFGTFVFATFVPNINFGIFTAFILGIALISDVVFLPPMLMVLTKSIAKEEKAND